MLATSTIGVLLSPNDIASLDVWSVPPIFIWLGAVVVKPPLNVELSPLALPKANVPVFWKLVSSVIVLDEPLKITL